MSTKIDAGSQISGKVPLANGGTNADLSATGAASNVLKQVSSGAAITVGQLAASDLSNGVTGSGSVVLATAPTMTNPVVGTQSASDNSTKAASTAYVDNLTVNAQTGTSYAILNGDINKLITFNNSAQIAATIAQAGSGGSFASGWHCWFLNIGTGTVVLTPATSTISGYQKLVIPPNSSGMLWSDGANYRVLGTTGANLGSGDSGLISLYDPPMPGLAVLLNNNWATITGANAIRCFKFNLGNIKGFGRATANRGSTTAAGKKMYAGFYDSAKNLLFQTPGWDMGSSGINTVTLSSTWLLMPGDYYFVVGADATTVFSMLILGSTVDINMLGIMDTVVQRVGPSPNAIVAGVLPSTLGTLGAIGSNNTVPGIYWEP